MTKHSVEVPIGSRARANIMNGKGFKVTPGEDAFAVTIVFKAKKHLTRLHKNYTAGKGTLIKPDMVSDIFDEVEGGSIFGKLRKALTSNVAKSIVNVAKPLVANSLNAAVTGYTGNPMLGALTANLTNAGANAMTGQGINWKGLAKKAGVAGVKLLQKEAVPKLANLVGAQIAQRTGNQDLADIGKSLTTIATNKASEVATNQLTQGQGVRKKRVGGSFRPLGSGMSNSAAIEHIESFTGNTSSAQPGTPFEYRTATMSDRMAYVRSKRKSKA